MENTINNLISSFATGPTNPDKIPIHNPEIMSEKVKEIARFLGADLVGITDLDKAYIYSHKGAYRDFLQGNFGQEIDLSHKYAICLGKEMDYSKIRAGHSYIENAEVGKIYTAIAIIAIELAAYIRELGYPAQAHFLTYEEVLHVPLAIKAGLGELGRSGILLSREYGPRLRLATVTTDLPLALDSPVDIGVQDLCSKCQKCATNCPAGAIPHSNKIVVRGVEKWKLDEEKCLKFWCSNPKEWMSCSNCITVCPWNKPDVWYHHTAVWFVERWAMARSMILYLDDILYGKRPSYKVKWLDFETK
jgi:reductive dehalogenase